MQLIKYRHKIYQRNKKIFTKLFKGVFVLPVYKKLISLSLPITIFLQ